MAWYKQSLEDLTRALEREDWETARRIVDEHMAVERKAREQTAHAFSELSTRIETYGTVLREMRRLLENRNPAGGEIPEFKAKARQAVDAAHFFEKTIQHLIKEERIIEKELE